MGDRQVGHEDAPLLAHVERQSWQKWCAQPPPTTGSSTGQVQIAHSKEMSGALRLNLGEPLVGEASREGRGEAVRERRGDAFREATLTSAMRRNMRGEDIGDTAGEAPATGATLSMVARA